MIKSSGRHLVLQASNSPACMCKLYFCLLKGKCSLLLSAFLESLQPVVPKQTIFSTYDQHNQCYKTLHTSKMTCLEFFSSSHEIVAPCAMLCTQHHGFLSHVGEESHYNASHFQTIPLVSHS